MKSGREFQTVGRQLKRPDSRKCWAGSEVHLCTCRLLQVLLAERRWRRVSTGDRNAVVRQVRWCAAFQTSVNCYCQFEKHPVLCVNEYTNLMWSLSLLTIIYANHMYISPHYQNFNVPSTKLIVLSFSDVRFSCLAGLCVFICLYWRCF